MLIPTNIPLECHYTGLMKLKNYAVVNIQDEIIPIIEKERTILHPPDTPESFFIIEIYNNTYFNELCFDIRAVINQARIPNFTSTYANDLYSYATQYNIKRATFGAFDKGMYLQKLHEPIHNAWKPYYIQYTMLLDDWKRRQDDHAT